MPRQGATTPVFRRSGNHFMTGDLSFHSKNRWRAVSRLTVFCRRNIDELIALWSGAAKRPSSDSYHGLLLGAALASVVIISLAAGALLAHITRPLTGPYGPYVCLPATFTVLNADTGPQGVETSAFDGLYAKIEAQNIRHDGWPDTPYSQIGAFSENISADPKQAHPLIEATPRAPARQGIVSFSGGRVSIETIDGSIPVARLRQAAALPPAPSVDPLDLNLFVTHAEAKTGIPPFLYGETLDSHGKPTRWEWRNGDFPRKVVRSCDFTEDMRASGMRRLLLGMAMPVPGSFYGLGPGKYQNYVSLYAEKYDLAAGLMLAIMHTESNFNPFAVSPNQAVGLMQIVPDTAGNEVYRYLMGTQGAPSMETLFSPEHNIKYGAIYLHLLGRRYFGGVNNAASRQLCIIAAYNSGPNAVLRLFDPNPDAAVERINALTPEQLYSALTTDMPNQETRRYVEVVMERLRTYSPN